MHVLNEYRKSLDVNKDTDYLFKPNLYFLQPCICYNVYDELRDSLIDEDLIIYSAKGECFRHEHSNRISSTRLNEFTMREIVLVGQKDKVKEIRLEILNDIWAIFLDLGLTGFIKTASDPFFLHDDLIKKDYELAANTKYEVCYSSDKKLIAFLLHLVMIVIKF